MIQTIYDIMKEGDDSMMVEIKEGGLQRQHFLTF